MRVNVVIGIVRGMMLVAGMLSGTAQAAEPLYIVKDGQAVATIVHPRWEKPVPPEKEVDETGKPTAVYAAKQAEFRWRSNVYFNVHALLEPEDGRVLAARAESKCVA